MILHRRTGRGPPIEAHVPAYAGHVVGSRPGILAADARKSHPRISADVGDALSLFVYRISSPGRSYDFTFIIARIHGRFAAAA